MKKTDNNDQTTWSGYSPLPTLVDGFSSGPCITSWSDTRIDVFARGETDNNLLHNYSEDAGATWTLGNAWESWGGAGTIAAGTRRTVWPGPPVASTSSPAESTATSGTSRRPTAARASGWTSAGF